MTPRDDEIIRLRREGQKMAAIAAQFQVSVARCSQIVARWAPELKRRGNGATFNRERDEELRRRRSLGVTYVRLGRDFSMSAERARQICRPLWEA